MTTELVTGNTFSGIALPTPLSIQSIKVNYVSFYASPCHVIILAGKTASNTIFEYSRLCGQLEVPAE